VPAEVLAVGTELLLGQVVDTNSSWIGQRLAESGIDCYFQAKVGDNLDRIVQALRDGLARSGAVICCGGLGPTQDDITREAIATVMGVELVRDEQVVDRIRQLFRSRSRDMPDSNLRQADVPVGATVIEQVRGTAPGPTVPVGDKVVYAVPGVPHEMKEMMDRAVLPDLRARSGAAATTIRSRTLRTWGLSESALAGKLAFRLEQLDEMGPGSPTIAFLASGIEGIKVRVTVKAPSVADATGLLDAEEHILRAALGDIVFGVDDQTMETAVAGLLTARGCTLGVAESVTGGLVGSRLTDVPGASDWFRGSVVSYASEVKYRVLEVPEGPVVSEGAARAMAAGAKRLLGADIGLAVTGVAGPTEQDGQPVGTVFCGVELADGTTDAVRLSLPGDRELIRQLATISLLDFLRRRMLR
jgi:nicotinamide-nucleotide amidase